VLVAPDVRHEIDASEGPVVIGFVDPDSELAAALWRRVGDGITCLSEAVATGWRAIVGDATSSTKHASIAGLRPNSSASVVRGRCTRAYVGS
jgi:hypothetical protein